MEYGDLLDEMFELYKKKFLLFTGICAVVFLPVYLLAFGLGGMFGASVVGVLLLPLNFVVTAAMTWAVSQSYLGKDATIAGSYKAIKPKILAFIGTMIVASIIIGFGCLLLIIPGIIFYFWYAFLSQVYVVEGKTWSEARNRSKQLAAGQWGRIFVLGFLAGLLAWIVTMIITWPASFLMGAANASNPGAMVGASGASVVYGVLQAVATSLVTPIQVIVFVLLYYDIRIRKEGFDIEMLAQSMGESLTSDSTQPDPTSV
jgi:hypothetical protein